MEDLLTTRQLQDLLKVDRITIYRMLADGRLHGVKVGQQWRFKVSEVEALLDPCANENSAAPETGAPASLPVHCIQALQNVFADIGQVAALVIDASGQPLTEVSDPCAFCRLMMTHPSGHTACLESWKEIALQPESESGFYTCHAGLNYTRAAIQMDGQVAAYLLAGQFFTRPESGGFTQTPDNNAYNRQMRTLVKEHNLPVAELSSAALQIPVLDETKIVQVLRWPGQVVTTIYSILNERASLISRLERIAQLAVSN
jgi:excisionase family DNA binding protein